MELNGLAVKLQVCVLKNCFMRDGFSAILI